MHRMLTRFACPLPATPACPSVRGGSLPTAAYNRLLTRPTDRPRRTPSASATPALHAQGAPMKPTTPDKIRNVALISHGGAGKTSLAEAMLFDAGAISRLGTVEAGTTTLDWDPDEHKRSQSINLAIG